MLLRKYKSLYSSTTNSFSTGSGVTITPNSVVGLPTDTEITLTFDRVNSSGATTPTATERIVGQISGSNFVIRTSPSSGRGFDSTTEASHTSPVVEMVWNATDWNDLVAWALTEHNQDGTHSIPSTSLLGDYAADTGAANAYLVALSPAISSYKTGMKIRFKAANANTTAATINANSLGVKAIKKADGSTALSAGDIAAGQIVTLLYDGTNFQMISPSAIAVNTTDTQTLTGKTMAYGSNTFSGFPVAPSAAVKSDQTTATSTSVYVSPGTQQYHPSAVKAWVEYKRSTATIGASYNISSVTDGGTGTATINFSVAMTTTTYAISAVGGFQSGTTENGTIAIDTDTGLTTGHFIATSHGGSSTRVDLGQMFLSVFGTQ